MRATFSIGSISRGTMRPEDLIPCFADELEDRAKAAAPHPGAIDPDSMNLVQEARAWADEWDENSEQEERGQEIIESLFDALNDYTPDYCYFGVHEGNGSDYGYWPCRDSLEDDAHAGEVLKVSDLSEVPENHSGTVWLVNDHGNNSLYSFTSGRETLLWGCA